MIEIEKRSIIDRTQFNQINSFLETQGTFVSRNKIFTMVYEPSDFFIPQTDMEVALRIRVLNDKLWLTLKKGSWHQEASRIENELALSKDQIKSLVSILYEIGFKTFVVNYKERTTYSYNGFTVVLDRHYSLNVLIIEVEIIETDASLIKKIENKIEDFFSFLKIKPMGSDDTIKFVTRLNSVKDFQVNLSNVQISDWYTKWEKYITGEV